MKKIFVTLILMATIVNTLPLFAGEYLADPAWLELRRLHSEYLGRYNDTKHGETESWIRYKMNDWLKDKKNEYERQISDLKKRNETLNSTAADTINTATKNIREQNQQLTRDNIELKNNFNRCKTQRDIAYSVIAIILVIIIAFILIKKCQAKKLPKAIEVVTGGGCPRCGSDVDLSKEKCPNCGTHF